MWLFRVLFLLVLTSQVSAVAAQESLPVPLPVGPGAVEAADSPMATQVLNAQSNPILACLRIPAVLVTEVASREFTHSSHVDRVVLGTHSRGSATCHGYVNCEMREQTDAVELVCRISGTVDSTTRGTNGPALIDSTAITSYTATKSIVFDGRKLITLPAVVQASTRLQITGISSSLPGLRGRIVQRVAERRAGESVPEAEAITRDLTAAELQQQIDQEFAQRIVAINRSIENRLPILEAFAQSDYKLSMSSQPEFIQLMFVRRDTESQLPNVPAALPLTSKIVLWIPLPGALGSNASASPSDQSSTSNFEFKNSEQWLLNDTQSFLPLWLTAAVGSVKAKIDDSTPRVELLLHENWVGVQFGQAAAH